MIDIIKAEKAFKEYLKQYDNEDKKVIAKINHTYGVVNESEYLSDLLKLSEENKNLAKLIALLHDIGRFEQAKIGCKYYDEAEKNIDHGKFGVKVLFEDGLIRNFIEDDVYDKIIYKSILNHNRLEIEEGLNEKELLHAKLIRDNDKTENIISRQTRNLKLCCGEDDMNIIENAVISDEAFEEFMNEKTISLINRKTCLDRWIGTMAFVFDYNFDEALQKIYNNNYINNLFNRIDYKNPETIEKVDSMKILVNNYMEKRLKKYNI